MHNLISVAACNA